MLFTEPDGLCCRWLQTYQLGTDSMLTRFDTIMPLPTGRGLQDPRGFYHITPEIIEFALQRYADAIENVKRLARERPGSQFNCTFHITHYEMARAYDMPGGQIGSSLRIRLPTDDWRTLGPHVPWAGAEKKSIELLKSWLSPSQLADYEKHNYFVVLGNDTGTRYRLVRERNYNILELDKSGALTGQKFCVIPRDSVAMGDQLLSQKIWLETDELHTLKIANKIARVSVRGSHDALGGITRDAVWLFSQTNRFVELRGESDD